jgi:hypothetical protein
VAIGIRQQAFVPNRPRLCDLPAVDRRLALLWPLSRNMGFQQRAAIELLRTGLGRTLSMSFALREQDDSDHAEKRSMSRHSRAARRSGEARPELRLKR